MCNNIVRIVELDVRSFGTSVPITKSPPECSLSAAEHPLLLQPQVFRKTQRKDRREMNSFG